MISPEFSKKIWSQNFNFFWVLGIKVANFLFQRSKRSRMTHHSDSHPIWAKFKIFTPTTTNFRMKSSKFPKKVWSQNFNFFWDLGIKVGYFLFQRSKRSQMTHHSAFQPIWAKFKIFTQTTTDFRMKSPKFAKKVWSQNFNSTFFEF